MGLGGAGCSCLGLFGATLGWSGAGWSWLGLGRRCENTSHNAGGQLLGCLSFKPMYILLCPMSMHVIGFKESNFKRRNDMHCYFAIGITQGT